MAGKPGSGRKGYGLEEKIGALKSTLILAVIEDCNNDPKRKLYWAEKFVNRLMPNEIKGSGEHGELEFKVTLFRDK